MTRRAVRRFAAALFLSAAFVVAVGTTSEAAGSSGSNYVDIDLSADEDGLWLTRADGVIETRGSAPHFGDRPPLVGGEVVAALAGTPAGDGYWLFTNKANVFAYGAAVDYGDFGHLPLAGDIVYAVATTDGLGYYLIGADGGIFTAGSARYHGSVPEVLPGVVLNAPIVAMSATPNGYVLVAADGGTFALGSAGFHGSIPGILPGVRLAAEIVGLVPGPNGYLMVGADGGIFNFGRSEFHGSLNGVVADAVVGVAVKADLSGYLILDTVGTVWALGDTRHVGVERHSGNGAGLVAFSFDEPIIVYVGAASVTVTARNAAGSVVDSLVAGPGGTGSYFYVYAPTVVSLDIATSADWTIEFQPVSYARHWRAGSEPVTGQAPDVVRLTRPSAGSALTSVVGAGGALVTAHEVRGPGARLMANSGEAFSDALGSIVPSWVGPTIVDIRAGDPWTLDLRDPQFPRTVDVTGDSVATTLAIYLPSSLTGTFVVRDVAIEGCGVIDVGAMMSGGRVRRGFTACANFAPRWAAGVSVHNPDVTLVVLGAWEVFDLLLDGSVVPFGSVQHDAILGAGIAKGVSALLATGTEVALLEVSCQYPVAGGGLTPLPERGEFWRTDHLNELLRAAAAQHSQVHMVTSPSEFCTDISIGNNRGLRWDGTHYGPAGGALIWAHLRDQLLGLPSRR